MCYAFLVCSAFLYKIFIFLETLFINYWHFLSTFISQSFYANFSFFQKPHSVYFWFPQKQILHIETSSPQVSLISGKFTTKKFLKVYFLHIETFSYDSLTQTHNILPQIHNILPQAHIPRQQSLEMEKIPRSITLLGIS